VVAPVRGSFLKGGGTRRQSPADTPTPTQTSQAGEKEVGNAIRSGQAGSRSEPSLSASGHLPPLEAEVTLDLLERVQHGDNDALEALFIRCMPTLRRWASGRLPTSAQGGQDAIDIVQDTLLSSLRHLQHFDARHHGALQAYLRQAVMNRIRDQIGRRDRGPDRVDVLDNLVDQGPSPLAIAIGEQNQALYEQALQRLRPADREAIINRLELQYSYEDLAVALDKPSAAAARTAVMRALKRLVEELRELARQETDS
jgi:RNA polymerase sigma-70 factor (ECF subfamily)